MLKVPQDLPVRLKSYGTKSGCQQRKKEKTEAGASGASGVYDACRTAFGHNIDSSTHWLRESLIVTH